MTPQTLRQFNRTITRKLGLLESRFGDLSLPPVQVHALIELDMEPCTTIRLAEKLKINPASASNTLNNLCRQLLVEMHYDPAKTEQVARLSEKGKQAIDRLNNHKDTKIQQVLDQLEPEEIVQLEESLSRYTKALRTAAEQREYTVRPLTEDDNAAIAQVIRSVSTEHGLSAEGGFSVADPNLDRLSEQYEGCDAQYWVICHGDNVLGGGGVAPLTGEEGVCELQKMYFMPELRGKGLSRSLALRCLRFAREQGYKQCYLETTAELGKAIALYEGLGFKRIEQAMGNTGHSDCQYRMLRTL
jgi:putative acetyltransferase